MNENEERPMNVGDLKRLIENLSDETEVRVVQEFLRGYKYVPATTFHFEIEDGKLLIG